MIIRVFRAIVHEGKQGEFEKFFKEQAVPHVKSQPGLVSLAVGRPLATSPTEFLMIMYWEDLDSVQAFAGDNWEQAVILDAERHLLKEVFVHHYEQADFGMQV